jgi:uncharacterized protein YecE (DUF72 family)
LGTKIFVGVSGFSYAGWKGRFYPAELSSEEFLHYYSGQLHSVEINSSFYAPPRVSVLKSWSSKTSDDFRFSFKAPRSVTHISKLGEGSSKSALSFSESLESIGLKRGPVLFQLPPYAKQDLKRLESFLSESSEISKRVFEFRNASWFQSSTYRLIERSGASLCTMESDESKPDVQVIGGLSYFRLRRSHYSPADIDLWGEIVRKTAGSSKECYVYLRHDETGENALLARRLSLIVGTPTRQN